ncbi:MAG: hypothetical protein ACE5JJ_06370 [Nitrospinota bacterium]
MAEEEPIRDPLKVRRAPPSSPESQRNRRWAITIREATTDPAIRATIETLLRADVLGIFERGDVDPDWTDVRPLDPESGERAYISHIFAYLGILDRVGEVFYLRDGGYREEGRERLASLLGKRLVFFTAVDPVLGLYEKYYAAEPDTAPSP